VVPRSPPGIQGSRGVPDASAIGLRQARAKLRNGTTTASVQSAGQPWVRTPSRKEPTHEPSKQSKVRPAEARRDRPKRQKRQKRQNHQKRQGSYRPIKSPDHQNHQNHQKRQGSYRPIKSRSDHRQNSQGSDRPRPVETVQTIKTVKTVKGRTDRSRVQTIETVKTSKPSRVVATQTIKTIKGRSDRSVCAARGDTPWAYVSVGRSALRSRSALAGSFLT